MGRIFYTSGLSVKDTPESGKYQAAFIHDLVGGYFEFLRIPYKGVDGADLEGILAVNDRGKLMGLPVNPGATALARAVGYDEIIVGDALFIEEGEVE